MKTIQVHTDHARRAIERVLAVYWRDVEPTARERLVAALLEQQLDWGRLVVLGDRARRCVLEVVSRGEGSNAQGDMEVHDDQHG